VSNHFTNDGRSLESLGIFWSAYPKFSPYPHAIDATRQSQAIAPGRVGNASEPSAGFADPNDCRNKPQHRIASHSIAAAPRNSTSKLLASQALTYARPWTGTRCRSYLLPMPFLGCDSWGVLSCTNKPHQTTICCPGMPRSASLALSETLLTGFHWIDLQVDSSLFQCRNYACANSFSKAVLSPPAVGSPQARTDPSFLRSAKANFVAKIPE